MARSYRQERLNERIKELIGELVQKRLKDPRIGLVTITAVSIAPDYATAKVYFTVMGDEAVRSETRKGLESARSFLRRAVGRELELRQAPDLRFLYDDTLDRAMRIDEVIRETRQGSENGEDEGASVSGPDVDDDDFGAEDNGGGEANGNGENGREN
jgi:ribosome-binding factor A